MKHNKIVYILGQTCYGKQKIAMASKDTGGYGGYFDGYIPATKEGLLKAIEELRKEIKQVKKISTKDKVILSGQIRKVEKRIIEIIGSNTIKYNMALPALKRDITLLRKDLSRLEKIVQKDQNTFNKDIVDIKEKVDKALATAEELQGELNEVPPKSQPMPVARVFTADEERRRQEKDKNQEIENLLPKPKEKEGKEEKAKATALTLRLCKMNSSYHPAHPQVPKEAHTTVRACEQRLLL